MPRCCDPGRAGGMPSCFHRPALEREQAPRPFLNKQDNHDENGDLSEHGTSERLKELVGDAERERTNQGSPQITDAAKYYDHETIDDVALTEVGTNVIDLRKR